MNNDDIVYHEVSDGFWNAILEILEISYKLKTFKKRNESISHAIGANKICWPKLPKYEDEILQAIYWIETKGGNSKDTDFNYERLNKLYRKAHYEVKNEIPYFLKE